MTRAERAQALWEMIDNHITDEAGAVAQIECELLAHEMTIAVEAAIGGISEGVRAAQNLIGPLQSAHLLKLAQQIAHEVVNR